MRQARRRRTLPLHQASQGSHGSPPGLTAPRSGTGERNGKGGPWARSARCCREGAEVTPPHCDSAGALGKEVDLPCVTRTAGSPMTAAGQNLLQSQALRLGRAAPAPGTGLGRPIAAEGGGDQLWPLRTPRAGPQLDYLRHLTSAGMDKVWRRSREELLLAMEGLSYVDRLKSLSPFSLERRRRRLRGIFAVWEHLKGDHKDSGQELIRLSSNRKQPPEAPGTVPPHPEGFAGFGLTALLLGLGAGRGGTPRPRRRLTHVCEPAPRTGTGSAGSPASPPPYPR